MRASLPCGAGCGRRLPPAGQRCPHIYGADELGPTECTCDMPMPDAIGECARCRRRIIPEEAA